MPKKTLGFNALCPRNSVSSGECVMVRFIVEVMSSLDSGVVCVVIRVCVVISQV